MMESADTRHRQPAIDGNATLRAMNAATDTATPDPEPRSLPADFHCVGCGYPSGKSGSVVCPECGRPATHGEVEALEHRRRGVEVWQEAGRARAIRRWVLIVVGYSLGAAIVARSWTILLATPTVLALAVWMSWNAGWVVARVNREHLRAHTRALWQRSLWRLHLPWLVAPLFVAVAGLAGLVDVWAGGEVVVYWTIAFSGVWLWAFGCLTAFILWWAIYLWDDDRVVPGIAQPMRTKSLGLSEAAAFVLGLGVVVGASGLGFGAGVVAADGVAEWLGLETVDQLLDDDW